MTISVSTPPDDVKRALFWVVVGVQNKSCWTLIDTGSGKNLLSYDVWANLPVPPQMKLPGPMRVLAGNNQPVDLVGWVLLRFRIGPKTMVHEFGVVRGLPIDVIIGGEFLRSHECLVQYNKQGRDTVEMKRLDCEVCEENRRTMKEANDPQLRLNLLRTPADRKQYRFSSAIPTQLPQQQINHREKLRAVLIDLKLNEIELAPELKHELISVIERRLDAFATNDDDVGKTNLIEHKIETGTSTPFKVRGRIVPFASREFVEQELLRLDNLGVISPADPGQCPYASPIVVVPKKDGGGRMCVDYRTLNKQTVKAQYSYPESRRSLHRFITLIASSLWTC